MQPYYIGIDVSAATLDIAGADPAFPLKPFRVSNDPAGLQQLARRLNRLRLPADRPLHIVLEPTGGYEQRATVFAREQEWAVCCVNPVHVRRWTESEGVRAKTDTIDARQLARFAMAKQPRPQGELPENARVLDQLLRRREDLQKLLRAENNRLAQQTHLPRPVHAVIESLQRSIAALKEELAAIESAIDEQQQNDSTLRAEFKHLLTIPGVGKVVVNALFVILMRFEALTGEQATPAKLIAHAGLDPKTRRSGTSLRGRGAISRAGNSALRALLFMGALGGVRGDNRLRDFYQRLLAAGKPKKVALVAAARKILVWAWAVHRSGTPFNAQFGRQVAESA